MNQTFDLAEVVDFLIQLGGEGLGKPFGNRLSNLPPPTPHFRLFFSSGLDNYLIE